MSDSGKRIHLSVPHMSGLERQFMEDAFASNWIAPLGPHVEAFEREFREKVQAEHSVALSTGTAALHLAYQLVGVGQGDEVLVSTLTFSATVNPILYLGARPVFIDSDASTWIMDLGLLEAALESRRKEARLPKAVSVVHLYGQCADLDAFVELCEYYGVPLIEDAAEALGASCRGRAPGTQGAAGIYSFNGNKVITTSGGGMLVSPDGDLVRQALKLATQAREPVPHYEHQHIGYNYRMSNILAAIGRGQLRVLDERVESRRRNFEVYKTLLGDLPGIEFMPEAPWCRHSRWLTTLTIDPEQFGTDREGVRLALEAEDIEARPVWKPMHRQPIFAQYDRFGGGAADRLFERGLCLPSSSSLTAEQLDRIASVVRKSARRKVKVGNKREAGAATGAGHPPVQFNKHG